MSEKASFPKRFEMIAGHPALDFVNSLDDRFAESKPVELLTCYEDLLRFVWQAELITNRQFRELRKLDLSPKARSAVLAEAVRLREALATILYAALDDDKPAKAEFLDLEAIFRDAASRRKLAFKDSRGTRTSPGLTWEYEDIAGDIRSPVWLLAQAANDLLTSPQAIHIRTCVNSTCRWLFLDTSKNHTRRWCDMKICGNRNKARRFHLRQVKS